MTAATYIPRLAWPVGSRNGPGRTLRLLVLDASPVKLRKSRRLRSRFLPPPPRPTAPPPPPSLHALLRDRRREMAEAVRAGERRADVARRFGVHSSTVTNAVKQFAPDLPPPPVGRYGGQTL